MQASPLALYKLARNAPEGGPDWPDSVKLRHLEASDSQEDSHSSWGPQQHRAGQHEARDTSGSHPLSEVCQDAASLQEWPAKLKLSEGDVECLLRAYRASPYLDVARRARLAQELGVAPRQVAVWFQNRRAREKLRAKRQQPQPGDWMLLPGKGDSENYAQGGLVAQLPPEPGLVGHREEDSFALLQAQLLGGSLACTSSSAFEGSLATPCRSCPGTASHSSLVTPPSPGSHSRAGKRERGEAGSKIWQPPPLAPAPAPAPAPATGEQGGSRGVGLHSSAGSSCGSCGGEEEVASGHSDDFWWQDSQEGSGADHHALGLWELETLETLAEGGEWEGQGQGWGSAGMEERGETRDLKRMRTSPEGELGSCNQMSPCGYGRGAVTMEDVKDILDACSPGEGPGASILPLDLGQERSPSFLSPEDLLAFLDAL